MRFSKEEQQAVIEVMDPFLSKMAGSLFLIGSRINDHARGGDIDFLILVEEQKNETRLREQKHFLLARLKEKLGDQRIDITIAAKEKATTQPFLKSILKNALLLRDWE